MIMKVWQKILASLEDLSFDCWPLSSCPQGSILGVFLFSITTNDLKDKSTYMSSPGAPEIGDRPSRLDPGAADTMLDAGLSLVRDGFIFDIHLNGSSDFGERLGRRILYSSEPEPASTCLG